MILKPGCLQRGLVGEVISRFEKRGLKLVAIKMVQLNDWEWLEGANGSILNRMDNKAAYQAVLAKYCNYVSTMPSSQGRLFNIA